MTKSGNSQFLRTQEANRKRNPQPSGDEDYPDTTKVKGWWALHVWRETVFLFWGFPCVSGSRKPSDHQGWQVPTRKHNPWPTYKLGLWTGFILRVIFNSFLPVLSFHTMPHPSRYMEVYRSHRCEKRGETVRRGHDAYIVWLTRIVMTLGEGGWRL